MNPHSPYEPQNKIRLVTAGSLYDGHDAAINVMRRILQATGAEVIHLGHNRSVQEIVAAAVQEDVQAVAVTSYQGGHNEFFRYLVDLLREQGSGHIKVFGGGGGTILPDEIAELQSYGVTRLYSPDDGRAMGLQGMIDDVLRQADFPTGRLDVARWQEALEQAYGSFVPQGENGETALAILPTVKKWVSDRALGRLISAVENEPAVAAPLLEVVHGRLAHLAHPPVLGVTGTGGAGKSSLVDEFVRRFLLDFPQKHLAIVSVDPSRRRTGGALLGDRIRMNAVYDPRVYMRSLATRQSNRALSLHIREVLAILKAAQFDLIILESSGIGQGDTEIVDFADVSLYVMTPEYGAATQLEKIDMLDYADVVALNKFDKRGAEDALRDVKKQVRRNHKLFDAPDEALPVFGTIAAQFADPGTDRLYRAVIDTLRGKAGADLHSGLAVTDVPSQKSRILPPERVRYLSEIAESIRAYDAATAVQAALANRLYGVAEALAALGEAPDADATAVLALERLQTELQERLTPANRRLLAEWSEKAARYQAEQYIYQVRGRDIAVQTHVQTLSGTQLPRIGLPRYTAWGDILHWSLQENVPGEFPYTAGVFPFKRQGEDPTRMFAGEGSPERTNRRFHYLSAGQPAKRLSTAFDSVTLYGEDPHERPDIYGKIGNSGVSVAGLDDAKKLYSGFDLCDPATSVSMTINGPAATMLAFFLNAAIDQQCEIYIREHGLEKEVEARL